MNKIARRLGWYWRMEAANTVIVPAGVLLLVYSAGGSATLGLAINLLACSALLAIGAIYWRAVLRRMEGRGAAFDFWLPRLAASEPLAVALVFVAAAASIGESLRAGDGRLLETTVAWIVTAMTALEYVNYYRVQLQHFDNAADFKRLLTGKGFRQAHMAREIAAWRRAQRTRE